MILKYIVVRDNHGSPRENGPERAILFDKELVHKHVARLHQVGGLVVISAGFVEINGYNVRVYGESETLNMVSRPDDKYVVNAALLGGGYSKFDKLWKNIDALNGLIDGNEDDDLGKVLAPIRDFFKSLLPPQETLKQD